MNKQEIENVDGYIETLRDMKIRLNTKLKGKEQSAINKAISAIEIIKLQAKLGLQTKQLNNGWIPVSERLPEDKCYPPVICCNVTDGWTDAAVISGKGYFINCEGIIIRPTHWRPLPPAYKEDTP